MTLSRREFTHYSLAAAALPAGFQSTSALAAAPKLRRGIMFHHLLNWPLITRHGAAIDYVWPPFATPAFRISDEELATLVGVGFDFARLTVDPSIFIASAPERQTELFDMLRERIDRMLAAGLAVVVDLHPVRVNPKLMPTSLTQSENTPAFRTYADLVGALAARLANYSGGNVIFEPMNEPHVDHGSGPAAWPRLQIILHDRIRDVAPDLPIVLTGGDWSDRKALVALDASHYKASNVYWTFHYYDPHFYTHQGFAADESRYVSDLAWPPKAENIAAARDDAVQRIDMDEKIGDEEKAALRKRLVSSFDKYAASGHGPDRILADFAEVARWADANKIARSRVLLGEIGAMRVAGGLDVPGRALWLEQARRAAEHFGFPWALCAYKAYTDDGFALYLSSRGGLASEDLAALGLRAAK